MTLPRTVAQVLTDHVTLEVESIDRMYLNVYQPRLQTDRGVASFFRFHRGETFASSALMAPMSTAFIAAVDHFVEHEQIPLITFTKGQRKDDIAKEYHSQFHRHEGIVFVGKSQEKTPVFRTAKRRNPDTGQTYPWIVRNTAMVNHYYFYGTDEDFGPFFIKVCTYFPYNAKLCINGHEYVKRQLAKQGIAFEALDNGILTCADPRRLQQLCDDLSDHRIDTLLRKWLRRLPHPFTVADRLAGYRYDVSILQAEFSLTQVLNRPLCGRVFFEGVQSRHCHRLRDLFELILPGTPLSPHLGKYLRLQVCLIHLRPDPAQLDHAQVHDPLTPFQFPGHPRLFGRDLRKLNSRTLEPLH